MKRLAIVLACAGCERVLGLDETTYIAPSIDAQSIDAAPPDGCTLPCQTFASCSALYDAFPTAPSGVYTLDTGTGTFRTYCDLESDGGGWTLAAKVDGRATTFRYDQPIWENTTLFGSGSPDLDHVEAKLETWNSVPFTQIRLGLEYPINSGTMRWLTLPVGAARLGNLFTTDPIKTTFGRAAWKGLVGPTASLQPNCNEEGTNVGNAYNRVRIGIVGNNEADCGTPDSRLGIGGADSAQCTFATPESAGNSACYAPDNGEVELPAFGWILVR